MKQIIQSFKTGETILEDIPAPKVSKGSLLIKTTHSLVSLGTERMLVEFGKSNLISKARQQPDKVKQVLNKIKTEGLLPTLEAVFNKLEQPIPLGYCNVGIVIEVGEGVEEFKVGDRVASNGPHAEYVSIPKNLVVKIPNDVTDEEATFTVIGSIGLQGIRLLNPTIGETIVVTGLGLIGLIAAQLLIANGCQVIGVDVDDEKLNLAKEWGVITCNPKITDPVKFVESITNHVGADGILITASSKDNDIISQSANMCRKRGKIVLVGVIGLNINRADFYEKELTFQVSCSYGPGRYDENYEIKGNDYPLPFVRWTEKRNFETILKAIESKKLFVKPLVSEVVELEHYRTIYDSIGTKKRIASILKYSNETELNRSLLISKKEINKTQGIVGIIGAGNFTKMTLLPIIKKLPFQMKYIASAGGLTATSLAKKYNINYSTTNYDQILEDKEVDLIMITTRHNSHSRFIVEGLKKNKNVFVEKPLAINKTQLEEIINQYQLSNKHVFVGFNRRFSPHIQKLKQLISPGPMNIIATMNAGEIPMSSWVQDIQVGGGRIIGEACHYIDLISYLCGSKVVGVCMNSMGVNSSINTDNATILLRYENGTNGIINYLANGSKSYSKERIEVFYQGKTAIVDNFRVTKGYGFKGFTGIKTSIDKGHKNQFAELIKFLQTGQGNVVSFEEAINTTKASFAALESLNNNCWVNID